MIHKEHEIKLEDIVSEGKTLPTGIRKTGIRKKAEMIFEKLVPELTINLSGVDIQVNISLWKLSDYKRQALDKWLLDNADMDVFNRHVEHESSMRRKYADRIQSNFDMLYTIHTELNYKTDLVKLDEINTLLFCEAKVLLDKMVDKINKKSTAKSIKLYKAMCKYNETEPITYA